MCMTQKIMTETFDVPATYVATQPTDVYSFSAVVDREFVQDATKKPCYIGFDYDTEHKSINKEETYEPSDEKIIAVGAKCFRCAEVLFQTKTYELPDENIFTVCAKRFRCAEVLFQTKTYSSQTKTSSMSAPNASVARKCCSGQMIVKCDVDIRKNLYTSVVLPSGARTCFMGSVSV